MKRQLLTVALIVAGSLSLGLTSALTQDAPAKKEAAKPADGAASTAAAPAKPHRVAHRVPKIDPVDGKQISPYSLAERTRNAKKDCAPGVGTHGVYRGYTQWDPQLKSAEGQRLYAACIKRGLEPAPAFAMHRFVFAMGIKSAFGRTKENCLECHSKGY